MENYNFVTCDVLRAYVRPVTCDVRRDLVEGANDGMSGPGGLRRVAGR